MTASQHHDRQLRYAAGLPWSRRRVLTRAELVWLRARVRRCALSGPVVAAALALSAATAWGLGQLQPVLAAELGGPVGIWLGSMAIVGCVLAVGRGGWMRLAVLLGALYLAGLAGLGALVPELTQRPHLLTKLVAAAMLSLGCTVLLAAAGRRIGVWARLRRIRADIRDGKVECFEGVAATTTAELERLERLGYRPKAGRPKRLDVLPRSGLVVCAHGQRCQAWVNVHRAEVAAGRPHALRVGLPEGVAPTDAAGRITLQRRSLSPQEQAELDRHIRRLRRNPWAAIAATAGLALAGSWHVRASSAAVDWSSAARLLDPMMLGWYALALVTVAGYARRAVAARKLDDDRRLRWVVTVDDSEAEPQCGAARLEVLPVSQLAWTENATPAGWRTAKL